MMTRFRQFVGILFLATLVSSQYNPLKDPDVCGLPVCQGDNNRKFKYDSDIQRDYRYSVLVGTLFNGTSHNESSLYIEGNVSLSFLTPCDGLLALSDFKLREKSPKHGGEDPNHADSKLFANMMTEHSLRFSFKDGIIAELCPKPTEQEWVLNFKRGILSLLQNSMNRLDLDHSAEEEDVRGVCPTDYRVIGAKETTLLIEKTKHLDRCRWKSRLQSPIKSIPIFQTNRKNNNVLKSSSSCTLSVDHNIYKEINCKETYLLQGFSNNGEGPTTTVMQKLLLVDESSRIPNEESEIEKRVSIIFDYNTSSKLTHEDSTKAGDFIKKLCLQDNMPDRSALADLFTELILEIRSLSYPTLMNLYEHSGKICQTGSKHLLDALPYVSNSVSMAVMREIINKKGIPEGTVNGWIYSMSTIANPDEEVMEVASKILQENNSSNTALGISSLAYTYCSQHSDCSSNDAVESIVNYLESNFLQSRERGDIDGMIIALKALSNIGVISQKFEQELFKVIENSEVDVGIRVAAVETFRRYSCEDTRSYFERIFINQDVNSEVRIASYLRIMTCPTYLLIRSIRNSLLTEEVNQVGSFVWSHLKNILKTANPSKIEVQSLLSDSDLVKKFNTDIRKFSRNFEGSIFFEEYNMGGNYEGNVIFSPSSYIPRSAMLNLTIDLFGEAVNIFEVYGRAEGFEHYLESLFGPTGSSHTLKEDLMDKLRYPRSTTNNQIIRSQVEKLPNLLRNATKDPKLLVGFKIFGNDATFSSFRGDDEIQGAVQNLNPVYHLKRILSGKEINYNKSAMFLDGKYVVPSGAGLPLSLTTTGTASINIKLYGSLKAAGFSREKELEVDLTADIEPTVSVDLTGEMSVDAYFANVGIKLKANVYTDTAVQSFVKIRGTKLASVKFSLPRKKNEIISIKSQLFVKRRGVEELQEGISKNVISKSACSWPVVDETVGLKLCTEYNFINVSRMDNIPYFLVAGPAGLRCFLHKSDPTANIYLFEYKMNQRKDSSIVTLIFDTPGSAVKRLMSVNLTIDRQSQNLTLLLQSSAGTVLARGKYKNTPDEKSIQVAIDINNKKHFDASASIKRNRMKNGFSYTPDIYLGVNGERVFRFSGNVDLMSKKGISQYSVELKFETKRFYSKLYGYITTSGTSIQASLFNDYKFQHTKEQRVTFEFSGANRSRKNMIVFDGAYNLVSTAYPNMNVAANATFQKSGNHMDLKIKVRQNPLRPNHPDADKRTLNFDLLLSYKSFIDNKRLFKAVTSLSRQSSNLALKGEFIYETFRYDVNMAASVSYGKNKEISTTVYWSHPRSTLEQFHTHINITIPSFTPMVVKLDVEEKIPKEYTIDFNGVWFSGHSISAAGFYLDNSDALSSSHRLKLLLRSPSFKETTIDLQFHRDNNVLRVDLKGVYDNVDTYELFINNQIVSEHTSTNEARIKYKHKVYSYHDTVYDGDYKKIEAEIYLAELRDIAFSLYILNKDDNKSLGFDLNWDANRDPNQKLMISANYKKYDSFDYTADFIVSYPGRKIKGDYKFLLQKQHIDILTSLGWAEGRRFQISVDAYYEYERRLYLEIAAELHTPFDNWKTTKLDGKFEHENNKYDLHGVVSWERRQMVAFDIFGDYTSREPYFSCKYSCSVSSTIDRIPNINTTIQHMQNETNFDTDLHLMYNPDFVIGGESRWKVESDSVFTNLTGTLRTRSPFKGLNRGILVSKMVLKEGNYLRGAAQMEIDHKKMDVDMEGYFKKLTDCRLTVNATTIDDDYQLRFIVSTERRQLVSMISYPSGKVGTEIILSLNSITDFDTRFILATPLEFLQDVIVVAKLIPEEADFRVSWNFLVVGFSGIWHYANVTDFQYSYKIYTPIEDFEENGIVGKLVLMEGLDLEFSIKLSIYKLGTKLYCQPKSKPLEALNVHLKNVYSRSKQSTLDGKDVPAIFSWEGLIELDIIIYPTMKGQLEIEQKGTVYSLQSKLIMPQGVANIFDEFEYADILKMRNALEITTPYSTFEHITSNMELEVEAGQKYLLGFNFDYQNRTKLIQSRVLAKYLVDTKGNEERIYNVTLRINTPFEAFPKLDLFGAIEAEENFYQTKLLFNTNGSDISMDTTTEIDNGLLELTSQFHVTTPSIYIPPCNLRLVKLFSDTDNHLEINLKIPEKIRGDIYFKAAWLIRSRNEFRTMIKLETPFMGLENTTAGLDVHISTVKSSVWTVVRMNPIDIDLNATLQNDVLTANSEIIVNRKRFPISVICKILRASENRREFRGDLKIKDTLYVITGDAVSVSTLPSKVSIKFSPKDNSSPITLDYQLNPTALGKYELVGNIKYSEQFTRFGADLTFKNKFNWDLHLQVDTSNNDEFTINSQAISDGNTIQLNVQGYTPIPKLENPKLGATYSVKGLQHDIQGFFEVTDARGNASMSIVWIFLENMFVQTVGRFENREYTSESSMKAFYKNPDESFQLLNLGGDIQIDKFWGSGTNMTLTLPPERGMGLLAHIRVPDETNEVHSLLADLKYTKNIKNIGYLLKYRTSSSLKKYGMWGDISMEDKTNLSGNIELEWKGERFNNFANLKRSGKTLDLIYKLKTPKFIDRQLLVTEIKYKSSGDHHNLTCDAFYPEFRSVAHATVDYEELANMNGMFNITIPHRSLNYTGAYFKTETNTIAYNRYIKVFWDGDNAVLDNKCHIKNGPTLFHRKMEGDLIIELPLSTRHIALVNYVYDKKAQNSIGDAKVDYNGEKVLEGKYTCLSESRAGSDKDTIHVELNNRMFPIGADYVYRHEYSVSKDGINAASLENKHVHLYHLQNRSRLNVKGELNIRTSRSGQEYFITAIHSNRIVRFWTDYDVIDKEYKQHSRLELSPSNWIEYDLNLFDRTLDERYDAQQVVINVTYPRRSFTAQGFYNISDSIVTSDVSLMWDKDIKTVQAGLDWRRASPHREQLLLMIKHPSFERDVTLRSEYGYNKSAIDGHIIVDYSLNPDQRLTLDGKINDNSDSVTYNYTYNILAKHNATNLKLNSRGDFYWDASSFGTKHVTNYQRSYLPLSISETSARINMDQNEIELKKDNIASGKSYFWGRYDGKYPVYTANMSAAYDTNDTEGEFYINFQQKLLYLNLNMTEDGSQSLRMYGVIPDARSAVFDIWREYEDKRVSDVAYYLKLNHSRLIMSSLRWRPELIADLQSDVRGAVMKFYIDTLEGINNTKQYVKAESLDAINGIWLEAKPRIQAFLTDLRNLTAIEEDIEELKLFLNNSYEANEFYIRDIISTVNYMFDELALKSHFQSLPKIVQEIWSVMGDSGQKLKKSVLWVIEKIKFYYKETTEFIHELITGDPVEHLSTGIERLVEKYDRFIKELHVAAIQYMENLWSQISSLIVDYWHKSLASLEPTFLKMIHYLESIGWDTVKGFLDFLYQRKNQIIESPYFAKIAKFSHDIDNFYKDITGNNTLVSIYKYSEVGWRFITEKYINSIPFGKEIMDIVDEIMTELKQIGEIPSIKYLMNKWYESYEYFRYYYFYFDMETRIHKVMKLVYTKICDLSVTALEYDNRHRKPKTKFIFEPKDGIMVWEQKLPMSWHAFNETPNFKEIPEIKRIYEIKHYLEVAQGSFWEFYYDFKPLSDPSQWFPPFKGHAMLTGSNYFVTFDKNYYHFQGKCTYLLATDYVDRNFTLLGSYNDIGRTNELVLILGKHIVHIYIFENKVIIDDAKLELLPAQIGETYLFREAGLFKVESTLGFVLECNMKFHTCTFEMSGWYYGKTAGLWGTYNNEPSDDLSTLDNHRAINSSLEIFGNSWALEKSCKSSSTKRDEPKVSNPPRIAAMCEEFFTSKVSQLSTCFPRIAKDHFLSMCLDSRSEEEACMSAVSYINLCSYANTPLRIPDTCVKCNLLNGTEKQEGDFIRLHGSDVPKTADVVFIVETKKCNRDIKKLRNFDILVELLEKELGELNIKNNKYAVVTFGGDGVFDEPRSIVVDGKTFADSKSIMPYFDNMPLGNGNADIFNGIMFAYSLIFRTGVSKNFVLIPCSECNHNNMLHDYSTIHQLLSESAISLHILMNDHFAVQKDREGKIPFGIDRRYAYTKRDIRSLLGDQPLRKSIILPKSTLGPCLSLALETNGTIFSAKYLEAEKKNAKKMSTVFAKSLARSAMPPQCLDCECTAADTGISYMECFICTMTNSTRLNFEVLGLDDEDMTLFDGFNF
ncbi:unnamed protein product [Phaedon cochleariae]|uniref:Vitellogenin domain-containing protein n=1 Tax=Phaedon cochleariae TaxID=80249 RepID=A0A9N9WZ88_PHACE|nr:unnamed protein product [Phaedon cochleariae]